MRGLTKLLKQEKKLFKSSWLAKSRRKTRAELDEEALITERINAIRKGRYTKSRRKGRNSVWAK